MHKVQKTALVILDGWGIGDGGHADAIKQAKTPVYDALLSKYPNATLKTFGEHVGLPSGQMGNSEVGHLNIGAGRVVYQDLLRIDRAIEDKSIFNINVLKEAVNYAASNGCAIHLVGLIGEGGVHSHQSHLNALINFFENESSAPVYIHAFSDGRDTPPKSAIDNLKALSAELNGKRSKLVSLIGRYYAMDRDNRWERIKVAYDLLVNGVGEKTNDFVEAAACFYDEGITDEFFTAKLISAGVGRIRPGDVVVCFNFRTDRCRQLVTALTQQDLPEWKMNTIPLYLVTMTRYDEKFKGVKVVFDKDNLDKTLGEVIASNGLKQLRIAETEKYPHVTFFFNGGREAPFEGEYRIMVNSPKVATYDLKPEMSAFEVTDKVVSYTQDHKPHFVCINFANPDMVGHTGVYDAILKAVETTDKCLGQVYQELVNMGYGMVIIADHGNADKAHEENGAPHTAHTTNPVPCIVVAEGVNEIKSGKLADIAPTILSLLGIQTPPEMSGESLIV